MANEIKVEVKGYKHPKYKEKDFIYEIFLDEDLLGEKIQKMLNIIAQTQQSEKDKDPSEKDKDPKKIHHPHTEPIPTTIIAGFKDAIK